MTGPLGTQPTYVTCYICDSYVRLGKNGTVTRHSSGARGWPPRICVGSFQRPDECDITVQSESDAITRLRSVAMPRGQDS
jgi:hypothetical protein